jgi:N-acetyl-D-muramate 6-phosphate phosphatase
VFDAVLFDLDGTLADTAPDMARTVNQMRIRRGMEPVEQAVVRPHVSKGARGMLLAAFEMTTDHPEFPAMREEFLDIYAGNLCVDSALFPGMLALLDRLEAGGIAWGVVTNKFERFARPLMEHMGIAARAGVIVGGDTCAKPKPFADPLLFAAAKLGVKPEATLYVGDDVRDVQAGHAAGMPVVIAAYGYLGDGAPPSEWMAEGIAESPAALDAWIFGAPRRARAGAR